MSTYEITEKVLGGTVPETDKERDARKRKEAMMRFAKKKAKEKKEDQERAQLKRLWEKYGAPE